MPPSSSRFKCLGCKELFLPSCCNRGRQRFCAKEACRKASKVASQRQWSQQPQNRDYFRGAAHVGRVRQWRAKNPGDARRKKREAPLQDIAPPQAVAARAAYGNARSPSKRFLSEGARRFRSQRRVRAAVTRFRPHSRSSLRGAYLNAGGDAVTRELSTFHPSSRRAGAARAGSKPPCFGPSACERSLHLLLKP